MNQCVVPRMIRYFELNGAKLTDVSAQQREAYMGQLGEDIYITTTWKSLPQLGDDANAKWYSATLMDMLLIYDALGEREVGYRLVQDLATKSLKTGHLKPNTYLDQIFLPTMAQLYQQNLPFVEPAYVGPNARQRVNYYQ